LYGCETWSHALREEQRLGVFEKRVPRKIFESMREEVEGAWRRVHNAELHNLYISANIISVIKSRRIRWAGHVACMRDGKCIQYFLFDNLKVRGSLEDPGIDGKIILEWILGKYGGRI